MTPTTLKAMTHTLAHTLARIEPAQTLLYQAAQAAEPLHGWADLWTEIGNHADRTKALWHKVNNAPLPTGHDYEPKTTATQ